MSKRNFSIGIDYGTNSVRGVVVDVADGREVVSAVFNYRRGENGIILDKSHVHVAKQSPLDYIDGFENVVEQCLKAARQAENVTPEQIVGIGIDTTGSTPIPVNREALPLAMVPGFKDNINAQAWLWKDHSSSKEAQAITELAQRIRPEYLAKCGGVYSSEWFFSKILHCLNIDEDVFDAAYSWIELADFVPAYICGINDVTQVKRGICAAGHKAMFNEQWGGLPDKEFLSQLHPKLAELRDRLFDKTYAADETAGYLSESYRQKFGFSKRIPVAVGGFDAHFGAVGAGVEKGVLVKIIGTSTCDITVSPVENNVDDIPGVCGIVNESVLPDYYGIEAGQSAVGDILNWFVDKVCARDADYHNVLTEEADKLQPGESGLLALDWNNGNRTILVDVELTGLLIGQTLQTTQAEIYRALIESTAFGALAIIERFEEYGVEISRVVNCGGIANKNSMFMQIYADIIGKPMEIAGSLETCALGSAIFGAAVAGSAAGGYDSVEEARKNMFAKSKKVYYPSEKNQAVYRKLYSLYRTLHDSFGVRNHQENLFHVMKELLQIKKKNVQ
ncbi:MAG: ribulokinase [FCB group bacterium]|nr:ribulokinase [FCB group bacterium]